MEGEEKREEVEEVEEEMLVLDRWTIPHDVHIPRAFALQSRLQSSKTTQKESSSPIPINPFAFRSSKIVPQE